MNFTPTAIMIGSRFYYKGYSLTDFDGYITKVVLSNVEKNATVRGVSYPFANSFGSVFGPRIAESRLFTIEGYILNTDSAIREMKRSELSSVFKIESNGNNNRFFPMNRYTKYGEPRTCSCMVYKPLEATNGVCDPKIERKTEIVAQDPRIYDPRVVTVTGGLGQIGAGPLWHILPYDEADGYDGLIECIHHGDRDAPMRISIVGNLINPKVFVIKDGEIKYQMKINKSTTNLLIDNTNTTAIESSNRYVVEDNGSRITQFIDINDDIASLFIPGKEFGQSPVSYVLVTADNYEQAKDSTVVTVSYRNTYSH